jgi:hypothetical protein
MLDEFSAPSTTKTKTMPTTKTAKNAPKKAKQTVEVEQTGEYRTGYLQAVAEAVSSIDHLTKSLYLDSKLNETELEKCLAALRTLRIRVQMMEVEQG